MEHVIGFEIETTRYLFFRRKAWALEAWVTRVEGETVNLETELSFRGAATIAIWKDYRLTFEDPLRLNILRTWWRRPDSVNVSVEAVKGPKVLLRWELPKGVEFEPREDVDGDAAAG